MIGWLEEIQSIAGKIVNAFSFRIKILIIYTLQRSIPNFVYFDFGILFQSYKWLKNHENAYFSRKKSSVFDTPQNICCPSKLSIKMFIGISSPYEKLRGCVC
ncbi:hypothetical protein KIL84_003810 [Mauremys mutica]|uniref:Uncharacterized protein n=1 Tax=Mauremys mutica TaxID=74926 RepID=A0A9D4AMX7_9SAUR|nr:hypothetical protein KIL84_003810 [Mauremys mutica]